MFLFNPKIIPFTESFPRIRGDVPVANGSEDTLEAFSPHTRGCSAVLVGAAKRPVVFPAYAGMFRTSRTRGCGLLSFPRIRGDVPSPYETK